MKDQLSMKIVNGLERVSEAFKALLWEKAKTYGISPIQIQILLFVAHHKPELCNVSQLAREFNVTKPTISDAVKVLGKKELVNKDYSSMDSRTYTLFLAPTGEKLLQEISDYTQPIKQALDHLDDSQSESLYANLTMLIHQLNVKGVLTVQRTCFSCRFYDKKGEADYCNFLQQVLQRSDIRLDCPEYVEHG